MYHTNIDDKTVSLVGTEYSSRPEDIKQGETWELAPLLSLNSTPGARMDGFLVNS